MQEISLRFYNDHQGMVTEVGKFFVKPGMGVNTAIRTTQLKGWKVMIWTGKQDYQGVRIYTGDYLEHRRTAKLIFIDAMDVCPIDTTENWAVIGNTFQHPELDLRYISDAADLSEGDDEMEIVEDEQENAPQQEEPEEEPEEEIGEGDPDAEC